MKLVGGSRLSLTAFLVGRIYMLNGSLCSSDFDDGKRHNGGVGMRE